MIELLEGTYIVGFWFAHDKRDNNWLGAIVKHKDNPVYQGWYRFRDIVDNKLDHTSKDKKRWQSFISNDPNDTEKDMIEIMDSIQAKVQKRYPKIDLLLVQGGIKDLMKKAPTKDWMNMQIMPIDDAKKKGIL